MASSPASIRQAAALPLWKGQVGLVTSSSGTRWVIPKGHIDPGHTLAETALNEAWEEAGLVGALRPAPLGSYLYQKYGSLYHVTVFLLDVTRIAEDWPEVGMRQRVWLSPSAALERIQEEGLRELIQAATAELLPSEV